MPRCAASARFAIWAGASSPYRPWNPLTPAGRNSLGVLDEQAMSRALADDPAAFELLAVMTTATEENPEVVPPH